MPVGANTIYRAWDRARRTVLSDRESAGPLARRPYDLRHSAASMWLANGASLRAVADRLGHEDPAITLRHYAHCLPSEQGIIADMASRLLQSHG